MEKKCRNCIHRKPLEAARHSRRYCCYALDVGELRGQTIEECTKKEIAPKGRSQKRKKLKTI